MFSVVTKSSKPVKAITGAEEAICFVMASICSYIGIQVALDAPATWDTLMSCYDALTEPIKQQIFLFAEPISYGVYNLITWETSVFQDAATQVATWFGANYHPIHANGLIITSNDNPSHLGFTEGSLFELYFPTETESCIWSFPSSVMWLYDKIKFSKIKEHFNSSYVTDDTGYRDNNDMKLCILKASCGLEFVSYSADNWHNQDCYEGQFIQFGIPENSPAWNYMLYSNDNAFFRINFSVTNYGKYQTISFFYDTVTDHTFVINTSPNGFAFVDILTGDYYDDRQFTTKQQLMDWFMTQCGFITASVPDADADSIPGYKPGDTTDDDAFIYNPDVTAEKLGQIGDIDDPTLDTVVPGSKAQVLDMTNNPDLVDVNNPVVYKGDIDLPSVNSSAWANRFPFCIPFDIVKLFTSFSATAEAPNFHILVLPANSFGLSNDNVYFDINFADYNVLVKLLRLFIAVSFTLFLIIKTRGLIRG